MLNLGKALHVFLILISTNRSTNTILQPQTPNHKEQDFSVWLSFLYLCLCQLGRRQWHPTPVLLPGKSHGQRSLMGCSPWGRQESDTTERLPFHFSLSCIGEGNPRDGVAWWAAVYGVAQSRTRLKRLSSSSSCQPDDQKKPLIQLSSWRIPKAFYKNPHPLNCIA